MLLLGNPHNHAGLRLLHRDDLPSLAEHAGAAGPTGASTGAIRARAGPP